MEMPKPTLPDPGVRENAHPLTPRGPWTATVTKTGRWSYRIKYENRAEPMLECFDAALAFGSRVHADNKARRGINRRNRREQGPPAPSWRVGDW